MLEDNSGLGESNIGNDVEALKKALQEMRSLKPVEAKQE